MQKDKYTDRQTIMQTGKNADRHANCKYRERQTGELIDKNTGR
jgi:hypothetical protein